LSTTTETQNMTLLLRYQTVFILLFMRNQLIMLSSIWTLRLVGYTLLNIIATVFVECHFWCH